MLVLIALIALLNGGTVVPNDVGSGYPDTVTASPTAPQATAPPATVSVDDIGSGYPDHP